MSFSNVNSTKKPVSNVVQKPAGGASDDGVLLQGARVDSTSGAGRTLGSQEVNAEGAKQNSDERQLQEQSDKDTAVYNAQPAGMSYYDKMQAVKDSRTAMDVEK